MKKKYQAGGTPATGTPSPSNKDVVNNNKLQQIREMQEKNMKTPEDWIKKYSSSEKPKYDAKGKSKTIRPEF